MTRSPLLALALLQLAGPAAPTRSPRFHYTRSVTVESPGQACVVLDAAAIAHAQPFLRDLRLTSAGDSGFYNIPYVLTLSESGQAETEPASILNLQTRGHVVDFDLAMPSRPYTEVLLDLPGHDFLATAVVTGLPSPGSRNPAPLSTFNLFDFTSQHLSRSTALHLQESIFPLLHVTLTSTSATTHTPIFQLPQGATVPPSREAQTLFTVAARTSRLEQQPAQLGHRTVAHLTLPARIPIERVTFNLAPGFHENFSRKVLVTTHTPGAPATSGDNLSGTIQRVKLSVGAREINEQQLSIPATLGANLQQPAEVDISILDGDDPPLPITAVDLEMRRQSLCFQATTGEQLTLRYGNPDLPAPAYDLAQTYTPAAHSAIAQLGPEERNPAWRPPGDDRDYRERNPQLLWIALLIAVCTLALVTFRSSKKRHHRHHHHHR